MLRKPCVNRRIVAQMGRHAPCSAAPDEVSPMVQARILVVDDEANARNALAEILKEEGYAVETAADGFKALPKLADFDPELIVTDLKMPGMDGLELMAKVQADHP